MQREHQNKLLDEMFSPISAQTLPASIEERLEMYRYRNELEENNTPYKIIKQKFLNYRQFSFKVTIGKNDLLDAYALSYSTLPRKKAQGRIEFEANNIAYFNREEIKFITLDFFNEQNATNYKSIKELIYNPLTFDQELAFRSKINKTNYDLSPIIVVREIPDTKLSIELDAVTYDDTQEKLLLIQN